MYNPGDAKIISIQPTFGNAANGTQRILRIRYTVRDQGPFTLDIPQPAPAWQEVERMLISEATKITDILDLKL